jgi:hypothetical protein
MLDDGCDLIDGEGAGVERRDRHRQLPPSGRDLHDLRGPRR